MKPCLISCIDAVAKACSRNTQNTLTGSDSIATNPNNIAVFGIDSFKYRVFQPIYLVICHSIRILLFLILISTISYGQDTATVKNKWHYLAEPYVMFPNMNGTVGLGNLPDADVNADAGDIFSHLQFGAMLYFEAHNDRWAISSDLLYMDLKQDVTGARNILSGEVQGKQTGWELVGLRKVLPWLEVGGGILLNSIKSNLALSITDSTGTTTKSKGITETWVDPIIVGRVKIPLKGKFTAQFRGNIGGFGIGSKLSWQLQAYAGYRFSELFELQLGYRVIGLDYEKGSGEDRFLYDVNTFGPVLRFGFHF